MRPLSILDWYRVVPAHFQLLLFEAVRIALWFAR
jgi:hypothetical protein